jgi:hypothetical protein
MQIITEIPTYNAWRAPKTARKQPGRSPHTMAMSPLNRPLARGDIAVDGCKDRIKGETEDGVEGTVEEVVEEVVENSVGSDDGTISTHDDDSGRYIWSAF